MQTEVVVTEILQYHNAVVQADKTIADNRKKQIEDAWNCGSRLLKAKAECPSNEWGKWCRENLPTLSTSKIQRYIRLREKSDLTECLAKYKTLNQAYIGLGITGKQKRVTVKAARNNGGGGSGNGGKPDKLKLRLKGKGGGSFDINTLPQRYQDQVREQSKTAPLVSDSIAATANYRSKPVAVKANRCETALRLIGELAEVLERDMSATEENGAIYGAMKPLAKWHTAMRESVGSRNGGVLETLKKSSLFVDVCRIKEEALAA